MFCPKCGYELENDTERKFCPQCGAEVDRRSKTKIIDKKAKTIMFLRRIVIGCIFRKNCASVPEERSAIPLQTEQSSAG